MPTDTPQDQSRERVKHVVEEKLAEVKSPEQAKEVLDELKSIPSGQKAVDVAAEAEAQPETPAEGVEKAAHEPAGRSRQTADVLKAAAAQSGTESPEAEAVNQAVQQVMGTMAGTVPEDAVQGRTLLQEAALNDLNPVERLDAKAFLMINHGLPRPEWAEKAIGAVGVISHGGWIWAAVAMLDGGFRFGKREKRILRVLLPTLGALNWIVEFPVKQHFRRERPFIDVVRALVIGKKPGSWSFPSGHTASSFAAAWVLSLIWPKRTAAFFSVATFVGFTRVYSGVHYPGDVISGALTGVALGEVLRRLSKRLFL